MRTFEVNGYPIAYVEEGRGEPLAMVHGSLSDYRYWARQAGPLSASLRVVSVSLRRHYPERWNGVGDDFTTRQHYEDVVAFRASLEKRIAGADAVGKHKTSMLQDVEAGRAIELDALLGAVIELGTITETPTPHLNAVYACASLLAKRLKDEGGGLKIAPV